MVNEPSPAVLTLMLDVTPESVREPIGWHCQRCHVELELHQPDAANPDRLLGTCGSCGGWYVVEEVNESRFLLTRLPDRAELRRAIEAAGIGRSRSSRQHSA